MLAQSGIAVKATIDKSKIFIGEHIELKLEADIPENELIRFFIIDTIPHFEFLDKKKIDTVNTNSGTVLTQLIRITSFDSGQWVIPPFYLADSTGTDSILVDVSFSPFDPNQPYHDIKDVIDVEVEEKANNWWWYAAAGGFLLLILILYLLLRKKKTVDKPITPPVDPFTDAMKKIQLIKASKPESKLYYSSLVDIFRQYVFQRKGISSLQKTTDDLVLQLRYLSMNSHPFEKLAQALRLSDFVKFAKYIPSAQDDEETMESVVQAIKEIEKQNE